MTSASPDGSAFGWSLRALLGLSIVLPITLFSWTAYTGRAHELEDAERTAVRTVTALHEHAAKVLETLEVVLHGVDSRIEGRAWDDIQGDAKLRGALVRIQGGMGQIFAITLTDAQGRVRATSSNHPVGNVTLADRDYFLAHVERDAGTLISAAYTSKLSQERLIALSKRRTTADGAFDGIVHVSVKVAYFTAFWEQFAPSVAHIVPLIRADGQIVARYPALDNPERISLTGPFMSRALQHPKGVYTAVSQVDGVERLNAYSRIKDYPLFIGFSIETRAVLERWHDGMALYGVYTLVAVAALLGATVAVMRRYRAQIVASRRWQEVADRLSAEMAAREKAEEALRQSQKMEAVGQITGGLAHDFNNLLQALTSSLYLVSTKVPAEARPFVDAGMQAVERGAKLVRQLMAFARRQQLEPQPVSLHALVAGMGDLLQKAVSDTVRIEVEIDRDVDPVMVDPTQTELALLNLAINARDAMAGGLGGGGERGGGAGRITVAARNVEVLRGDGGRVKPGNYVVLSVSDTGCGMAPEVQARAFDPFFTTKEVGKGTGLGLSMVHGFANQSGGGVELSSRAGLGTTVSLYLPKADAAPGGERRRSEASARALRSEAILLVDDDALGRMATAMALQELGYRVHEARDGAEALAVLDREDCVDMMVTDYSMPGTTGAELAAIVRRARPGIKMIMITGYAASTIDEDEVGVAAILRKPFRVEELAKRIRAVLAEGERRAEVIALMPARRG